MPSHHDYGVDCEAFCGGTPDDEDKQAGPRCPECGWRGLVTQTQREEYDFDTGRGIVRVKARRVPVEKCPACGLVASGPLAAGARADATLRAVLELLHKLVPGG